MSKEHIGGVNIDPSLLRRSDCESGGSMSNPMYRNIRNSGGVYLTSSGRYIRRRMEPKTMDVTMFSVSSNFTFSEYLIYTIPNSRTKYRLPKKFPQKFLEP